MLELADFAAGLSTVSGSCLLRVHGIFNEYKSFRKLARNQLSSEFDSSKTKHIFLGIAALLQLIICFILIKISG